METKDSGILQKEVNVVVSKAPVLSPIFESVEVGTSLRDIFNSYSGLSEQHTKIFVSGEEKSDWDYPVKEGDYVSVCQIPQGGSGDWLGVASFVFPVFALIPAAIYAGYQLYKMLDQPTDQGQGERLKRVTGARNEATPYEPIPVILGDRRVTPVYAAQPYTYWKGKEQWLKMLLCVGYGPLNISDIKIGDSPIWSFDDINYSVLDWNTTKSTSGIRSIWNKDIQQDSINQELGKENYISRSAPAGTDKITLEMVYPQGLWATNSGDVAHSGGGFQFRYYVPGRGWYSIARVASGQSQYVFRQLVKINGRYYINQSGGSRGYDKMGSYTDVTSRVDAEINGYAYIRDVGNYYYVNTVSYWHATRDELIKSWSFVPIDPITGAKLTGDVPFEVKRNGWDYDVNSAGFSTTLQLNTITYELAGSVLDSYFGIDPSLKRYPVLIALDVRASEQLSGVIDNLSCRAQSLIPQSDIYNDFKNFNIYGNWYTTNNPANMYKWMLQGPFNGAAVDNDRLDNSAIAAWESECYSRGWECNEIINEGINLKDLLNNIAFTGRAFFSMRDGKFSVIQNRAQSNPTQVFTTKNSRGLKSRREFDLETDGVKYTFANGDFQDQEDEGIYGDPDKFYAGNVSRPKPGANITGRYEDFSVWGTTSPTLARKHARFAFFEKRLRREVYQLETDVESLIARRGDKVLLAHDVIDVGLGQGFIKEIDGYTFRIDETINLTAGKTYTLTIRSVSSGTQFYNTTATYQGDGWWSGSLPSYTEVGNLVAYGESGTQTLECLVTEITYSNNYEATLTLVNYADNLFTVDYGYLPEYESNLNPERPRDITPLAPSISVNYGSFTYESNAIIVNVSQQRGDRALLSRFSLQYKYDPPEFDENGDPIDIESDWQDGGVSPADDGTFRIPVSNNQGNVIYVRATAVNEAGVHSPFSVEKKIELQNDPAPDVEDFTVTEAVDTPKTPDARWSTLTIEITPPEVMNGYLYAIAEYRQPGQATWANIGTLGWRNPNSIDVQVYADGRQYEIRVRSASIYGVVNKNGLSKIFTTTNTSDPEYTEDNPFEELPAPNVRGLELFDQGNDTEFTGRDAKFTWRKSTLNDWVDLGYEGLKGASNAVLDQYFRDYEVEITANDEVVRTENVVDNFYTYTYEKNAEDYERRYGVPGAYREFRISVVMRTRQNQESPKPAVIDVTNTAPKALENVVVNPGFNVIEISYKRPTDLDFAGVDIWIETTQGFDPDATEPFATISDNSFVASGLNQDTVYYVRLRPFDEFGKTGTNTTSEFTVTTKTGQDLTGLSGWAYELDPVDETFINTNLAGNAVPSEKIKNLTAAKLTAGVINATGAITTESIFRAVDDINNPQYQVGIGPLNIDGTSYLMWGYDANAGVGDKLKFGIDELGNAYFRGDITGASGTFSGSLNINSNFVVDSSGNVDSSGGFRFGGATNNFIDYNGSKLAINTDNFTVDPQGNATFSGELQAATGVLGNPSGNRVEFDGTNLIINTHGLSVDGLGNAEFSGELQSATGVFGNKASGKYIEFDGTDLIIGPESTIGNNNDITVTVGSTGDYATINEALEALSRTVPVYKSGGFNAEIQILTGTIISENIHVVGIDLGWITITHENGYTSRVQVDGSSVQDFFIKVEASGVGPNIDFPLEIINSNLSISSRIFYLVQGSRLTVNTSGLHYSSGADFIGRGIIGSCVRCETGSIFESVGGMNIEDFGVGFVADNGSRIINGLSARLENCTKGIYIDNGSVLDSVNIRVSNVRDEVGEVRNSSFANLSSGVFLANLSFTRVAGIHCQYGSVLNVSFATFNDFNYSPIRADFGGMVTAYQADTVDDNNRFLSGVTGIVVARGSTVSASLSTGTLSQTANTITSSGIIFR
jgi:hypothetical protein